jgi:hypothetical protein
VPSGRNRAGPPPSPRKEWQTSVPLPRVETPTRYRAPAGRSPPARLCFFRARSPRRRAL